MNCGDTRAPVCYLKGCEADEVKMIRYPSALRALSIPKPWGLHTEPDGIPMDVIAATGGTGLFRLIHYFRAIAEAIIYVIKRGPNCVLDDGIWDW